jgi:hypothetical protein
MGTKKEKSATEWPQSPPLKPGQGDELRKIAGPGDDTVFEANDDTEGEANDDSESDTEAASPRSKRNPRSANDDRPRSS